MDITYARRGKRRWDFLDVSLAVLRSVLIPVSS